MSLPLQAWKKVCWRPGTRHLLQSRFAAVLVRPAHRDFESTEPYPEQWLLVEWPRGEADPIKDWLATLPAETKLTMRKEAGAVSYHHATLCIAASGFLVAEKSRFSCLLAPVNWNYSSPKCRPSSALWDHRIRLERHNPWSIATLRQTIARILL